MTAVQLTAALHREMSYIVTDSTMMERALKALRQIRKQWKVEYKEHHEGDSPEQIITSLKDGFEGLKLMKEGKLHSRPIEELFDELPD